MSYLRVNTLGIVDSTVVLDDSNAGSTGTDEVTAGVQTYVTEALNDEGLATPSGSGAYGEKKTLFTINAKHSAFEPLVINSFTFFIAGIESKLVSSLYWRSVATQYLDDCDITSTVFRYLTVALRV